VRNRPEKEGVLQSMRGTIWMLGGVLLVLLGGGLYLFGNTEDPEPPPLYDCDLSQLKFRASSGEATGSLMGALEVENDSVRPCRLDGFPELRLRTEAQEMTTSPFRFQEEPSPLTLGRGEKAVAGFIWRNWCGEKIEDPIFLVVRLPNYNETFTVPMLDARSTPSTSVPRCDAPEEQSELSTGPFLEEGAALYGDE
jgi:hypothetical protein